MITTSNRNRTGRRAATRAAVWLAVAAAAAACKSSDKQATGGSGTAAAGSGAASGTAAAGSGAADPGAAPARPARQFDDAKVQALVDAWLAAQNGGDFDAYSALYATRMEGVKRVAARTWRYDRKGWLTDRKRMFKHPMTVSARFVNIGGAGRVAVVNLIQTFSQGKFKDEGPKRMVVVEENGDLRIAREEMLLSQLQAPPSGSVGSAGVRLIAELAGKPYLWIDRNAKESWGSGPLRELGGSDPFVALREAGRVPDTLAPWKGKAITAFAADGTRCDATVTALALIGGGTPHFGEVQAWDGEDDEPALTPAQRTAAVFGMSEPVLVGTLSVPGGCKPVVAIDSGAPVFFSPKPGSDPAAEAAFAALPAYKDIQREYADYGQNGDWASPDVTVYEGGGRRFITLHASEGDGCGSFEGRLWALYEDKGGQLTLLAGPEVPGFEPTALLDSDGDGQVEIVGKGDGFGAFETLLVPGADGYSPAVQVEFPYNDCPC